MEFYPEAIFIGFDVVYKSPQFKLLTDCPALLQSFYKHIAERYPFSTSDISGGLKTEYSNFVARISLFRGNGRLDIYLDKFTASFENLISAKDGEVALDCMQLAEIALTNFVDSSDILEFNIRPIVHYRSKKPDETVRDFLTRRFNPAQQYSFPSNDSEMTIHHGAKFEFESSKEKWRVAIDLYRSTFDDSVLILNCNSYYSPTGVLNTIMERGRHLERFIEMFLQQVGINIDRSSR